MNKYSLPPLKYGYADLAPHISEEQLTIHHTKHHNAYVNGANTALELLEKARNDGSPINAKATYKDLAFQVAGHKMHALFWENLAPTGKGGAISSTLESAIVSEFKSIDMFKKEFSTVASSIEGSGWSALFWDKELSRLMIMQIEKHGCNLSTNLIPLLVLDVFEHAYYLDYKNERGKFVVAFWNIVNWEEVSKRFDLV